MKIGEVGKEREVFVYRGDMANRAIQLGIELQMFTERKEIKHLGEFEKLSNAQLVELLTQKRRRSC